MNRRLCFVQLIDCFTVVTAGRSRKSNGFWKGQADQLWWRTLSIITRVGPDIDIVILIYSLSYSQLITRTVRTEGRMYQLIGRTPSHPNMFYSTLLTWTANFYFSLQGRKAVKMIATFLQVIQYNWTCFTHALDFWKIFLFKVFFSYK